MSSPHAAGAAGPTQVGEYRVISKIGEGGMGIVYLAERAGKKVALKVLRPHIVGDDEARQRLAREVTSLRRIRSRWVAEILDADPWAEIPYVATRFVPGLSLYDHVHQRGTVRGPDLVWLAAALAEGIRSVHAAGVLHRDVKPSNVLMEGRTPILIDFGLARVADDPRLTQPGWLLGTPGYLAPEVLHGHDASPASDLHSWATTVAFAGIGREPFGRGPVLAITDRVRRGEVDLSDIDDPALRELLYACLAPDPTRRPPFADVVAWLRHQVPAPAEPAPMAEKQSPLGQGTPDPFADALALFEEAPAEAAETPGDPFADALALFDPADDVEPPTERIVDLPTRPYTKEAPPPIQPPPNVPANVPASLPANVPVDPPLPAPHQVAPAPRPPTPVAAAPQHVAPIPAKAPEYPDYGAAPAVVSGAERVRRLGLGALLAPAAAVASAAFPWVSLVVVSLLVWVLRAGSLAGSAAEHRRALRGRRWYDHLQVLLASPWHVLQALPGAGLLLIWAAGLALSAGLICYAVSAPVEITLLVGGLAFGVSLWWGPGGSRFRGPVTRLTHPLCVETGRWTLALAVIVAVILAGLIAIEAHGPWWFPGSDPPLSQAATHR